MPPDMGLLSTLIGSNYPCLELIFMVPKVFEPLKFDCSCFACLAIEVIISLIRGHSFVQSDWRLSVCSYNGVFLFAHAIHIIRSLFI